MNTFLKTMLYCKKICLSYIFCNFINVGGNRYSNIDANLYYQHEKFNNFLGENKVR